MEVADRFSEHLSDYLGVLPRKNRECRRLIFDHEEGRWSFQPSAFLLDEDVSAHERLQATAELEEARSLLDTWCGPLPRDVWLELTHVNGAGPCLTLEVGGMTSFPSKAVSAATVFRGLCLFRELAPLAPLPEGYHKREGRPFGWIGTACAYSDIARQHTVYVDDIETAARCVQFDSIVQYALETGRLPVEPSRHRAVNIKMIDLSDAGKAVAKELDAPLEALRRRLDSQAQGSGT